MWIEEIIIKNFRSIGDSGVKLSSNRGLNTIVGPNNVGKSSLFAAAKIMWDEDGFVPEDYHWRIPSRPTAAQLTLRLRWTGLSEQQWS